MRERDDRQGSRLLFWVGLVVLTAVAGRLLWAVWRQVDRLNELARVEAELAPLVLRETERNEQLSLELAHVSSPDYSEEWARVHAGLVLPGEVRVVIPPPAEPIEPTPSVQLDSPPPSFLRNLWQRVSGSD